jgi:hypothetical protein
MSSRSESPRQHAIVDVIYQWRLGVSADATVSPNLGAVSAVTRQLFLRIRQCQEPVCAKVVNAERAKNVSSCHILVEKIWINETDCNTSKLKRFALSVKSNERNCGIQVVSKLLSDEV